MADLTVVSVFTVVGFAIIAITLTLSHLLAPRRPNHAKGQTYECGAVPFMQAWRQMNPHYYLFALLFVIFDVEAALLFPVALVTKQIGLWAKVEVLVFVVILGVGLIHAWRTGGTTWE